MQITILYITSNTSGDKKNPISLTSYSIGTGKEGNLCEIFYYLVDFFHGLMDMGVVDFMNKNKKKSAKA